MGSVAAERAKESLSRFVRSRIEAGESLGRMAMRTGIAKTQLFRISNGISSPTVKTILALCDNYGISPNQLLGWDNADEGQA